MAITGYCRPGSQVGIGMCDVALHVALVGIGWHGALVGIGWHRLSWVCWHCLALIGMFHPTSAVMARKVCSSDIDIISEALRLTKHRFSTAPCFQFRTCNWWFTHSSWVDCISWPALEKRFQAPRSSTRTGIRWGVVNTSGSMQDSYTNGHWVFTVWSEHFKWVCHNALFFLFVFMAQVPLPTSQK